MRRASLRETVARRFTSFLISSRSPKKIKNRKNKKDLARDAKYAGKTATVIEYRERSGKIARNLRNFSPQWTKMGEETILIDDV